MPVSVPLPPQALARHSTAPLFVPAAPAPSPPGFASGPEAAPDSDFHWPELSPAPFGAPLDAAAFGASPEPTFTFGTPAASGAGAAASMPPATDAEVPAPPVYGDPCADVSMRPVTPDFEPVFSEPYCPPGMDFGPEYFGDGAPRFL